MAQYIGKRYRLEDLLGKGGMGEVYSATDRLTGNTVALKRVTTSAANLMFNSRADSSNLQIALAQEFKTLASLRHPHIISVLDYGFDEQRQPYFTMEYLDKAQTITAAVQDKALNEKIDFILDILQALVYLHQRNILHRDLKPDNVLVVDGQVKVMDFGLSLATKGSSEAVNELAGTIAYMAPELLQEEVVSKSADLYAVGMIAYEMLAGQYPFRQDNIGRLVVDIISKLIDISSLPVNDGIQLVLGRLLVKTRNDRYDNARVVINALCDAADRAIPPETRAIRESFLQAAQFVGREVEFKQLLSALEQALAGKGSACLIGGESGIGKTRLIEEMRTHALVQGALVLHGQGISEGGSPYQLWRNIFRTLTIYVDLTKEEASALKPFVPDISTLLGYDVPSAPELDPQESQERLMNTVAGIVRRLSSPMILILEDLQWASDSLALLKHLCKIVDDLPVMIIGNYRNDERPNLPTELPDMQLLELNRLDIDSIERLSASMLGEAGRQPHVVDLLHRESEGNIFFVVEIVRFLAEEAGNLANIGNMTLPAQILTGGVQAVIERRLNRLPDLVQEWLKPIAIAGRQLDMKVVEAITQRYFAKETEFSQKELLTLCSNAAVLEIQEVNWRFAHDKLREYILQHQITDDERVTLYRRVAEAIEAAHPDSEDHVVTLAQLWGVVGDEHKELHYTALGGKQAFEHNTFNVAVKLLSRALELLRESPETDDNLQQQWELQVPLALALRNTLGYTAQKFQEALDHAWQLLQKLGETAEFTSASSQILWQKWVFHISIGEIDQGWLVAQEFHEAAQKTANISMIIEGYRQVLTTAFFMGDLLKVREPLDKLLELYDMEQHSNYAIRHYGQDPAVMALSYSSLPIWLLGYPEQALRNRQKAIDLAQEINHSVTTCFSLYLGNFPNFLKPDTATTQTDSVNLLEIAQQHEASVFIGFGKVLHGWVIAHTQNREEGIQELIEGQDKLKTIGLRLISSLHWHVLLDAYSTTLDLDEGLVILDKAFDYAENSGERFMIAEMYRWKGKFLLEKGDAQAAEASYEKSLEVARRQSAKWWELRTTTSLARLWQSQGKVAEAREQLATVYNWFTEGFDTHDLKAAKALLDELSIG